jgi:biopolymer transport protein ExbD
MNKGGYLLRFVDVVLILLFGFIVISDVDEDSQIILPSSYQAELVPPESEFMLFIGIDSSGQYFDERENVRIPTNSSLRNYITRKRNEYGSNLKVRIRANFDTEAKYVMIVAQICDDLGVKKAIDVRKTSK